MKQKGWIVFVGLVALILVSRFIPHPANFTALIAVALFSGSFFAGSAHRFVAPMVAMFVSDIILGFYPGIEVNYIAVALSIFLAPSLTSSLWSVGARSVAASVVFFIVSNLGVWLAAGLYPMTAQGLQTCFIMAWPFYPALLTSSVVYSVAVYSLYRLALAEQKWQGFFKLKHG